MLPADDDATAIGPSRKRTASSFDIASKDHTQPGYKAYPRGERSSWKTCRHTPNPERTLKDHDAAPQHDQASDDIIQKVNISSEYHTAVLPRLDTYHNLSATPPSDCRGRQLAESSSTKDAPVLQAEADNCDLIMLS